MKINFKCRILIAIFLLLASVASGEHLGTRVISDGATYEMYVGDTITFRNARQLRSSRYYAFNWYPDDESFADFEGRGKNSPHLKVIAKEPGEFTITATLDFSEQITLYDLRNYNYEDRFTVIISEPPTKARTSTPASNTPKQTTATEKVPKKTAVSSAVSSAASFVSSKKRTSASSRAKSTSVKNDSKAAYTSSVASSTMSSEKTQDAKLSSANEVSVSIVKGTKGANFSEGCENLYDGNVQTKWCVTKFSSAYVIFEFSSAASINGMIITTANDNSVYRGRSPRDFALYGSNQSSLPSESDNSWEFVAAKNDDEVLDDTNYKTCKYSLESESRKYKYYKLEITKTKGANVMQMSEFSFLSGIYKFSPAKARSAYNSSNDDSNLQSMPFDLFKAVEAETISPQIIQNLIKSGADVNAKDEKSGQTVLIEAIRSNREPEVIKALVNAGAELNVRCNDGATALMWAARYAKNPEVVKVLINAGANPNDHNIQGITALMGAVAFNGNLEVIKVFLDYGADIFARTMMGRP